MERLGHSSITVTMDTYGHLLPSLDDDLTAALEDRYRRSSDLLCGDVSRGVRGEFQEVVPLEHA